MDGYTALNAGTRPLTVAKELSAAFAERAAGHDREGSFPHENFAELRHAGLLGLTASRACGGDEAGLADVCGVLEVMGKGCPSTALVLAMQLINVAMARRSGSWSPALADRIGRSAVTDGALINVLRVEAGLGTPARGGLPATTARRVPEGWSISGRKTTATGAPGLTWMLVFAQTGDPEPLLGSFLVPARAEGVQIVESWDQLGLRASGSHDVILTDVVIPADHAVDLRQPAGWFVPDPQAACWSALSIAALYTGVASAARDWLVTFLCDRVPTNLGAPLATLPRMQIAVGEIDAKLLTSRRLIAAAAQAHDLGEAVSAVEPGLVKLVASDNAIAAVQRAVEVAGNPGLSRRNPLERHLRDVLCARIHSPQTDTALLAAGRLALGI